MGAALLSGGGGGGSATKLADVFARDGGGGGGGGEAEAAFELKVCDWEGDNWPVTAAEIGPARCRLRDNLMLARCAAALYADLRVFSTSENLAARYGKRLFAPFLY